MRSVSLAVLLALGLAAGRADAQRRPTAKDRAAVESSAVTRRTVWADHQPFFEQVDRVLGSLHGKASARGYKSTRLNSMSPIQLTGSGVYGVLASIRKGSIPKFDDIDLRMVGVTADEVRAAIIEEFPEVKGQITIEPAYLPGLVHMQAEVGGRQLDISIYPNSKTYLAPHQRLSIAALKLNIRPENRLLPTLRGLLDSTQAREHRARGLLYDPAGTGLEDAEDGIIRTYHLPGMDGLRAPEGILHSAYWKGKNDDRVRPNASTMDEFTTMSQSTFKRFFGTRDQESALARRNYVFSVLRVKPGRNPIDALRFLESTGALGKILPGMDAVIASPQHWRATKLVMTRAYTSALKASDKRDPRWAREVMLAAVLSGLGTRESANKALSPFLWLEGTDAKDDDFSRARVLGLHTQLSGLVKRYKAELDRVGGLTRTRTPKEIERLELRARVELERGVARVVTDHSRKLVNGPVITGAWARSVTGGSGDPPLAQGRTQASAGSP